MRKLLIILLFPLVCFSQSWKQYYDVPTKNTQFGVAIGYGQVVFLRDSSAFYKLTHLMVKTDSMATVFRSGWYVKVSGSGAGSNQWVTAGSDIYRDSKVGVGPIAPLNPFMVQTSAGDDIPSLGTNGGKVSILNNGGLYGALIGIRNDGNSWWQTQRIDASATAYNMLLQPSGGKVGIGITSSPATELEVNGTTKTTLLNVSGYNVSVTGDVSLPEAGGGGGTVTSVATTSPLTGGPITGVGTVAIHPDTLTSWRLKQNQGSVAYGWNQWHDDQDLAYSTRRITITDGTSALIPRFSTADTNSGMVKGSNGVGSTYFLNGVGNWAVPPDQNTTYTAGYGLTLAGTVFKNTRYQKDIDTVQTALTGLLKATTGKLSAITDNSTNWNTAYGWGNHASQGYIVNPMASPGEMIYLDGAGEVSTVTPPVSGVKYLGYTYLGASGYPEWKTLAIPAVQIQSDWNQTNNALLDYIKNKPTLTTGTVTSITQGYGLTFSTTPLVSTGSIKVDTSKIVTFGDTIHNTVGGERGKIATYNDLPMFYSYDTATGLSVTHGLNGGTWTPTHTYKLRLATAVVSGALSHTDWVTFNGKVSSRWSANGTSIYYNTGNVGIGTSDPQTTLQMGNSITNAASTTTDGIYVGKSVSATARGIMSALEVGSGASTTGSYQGMLSNVVTSASLSTDITTTANGGGLRNRYMVQHYGTGTIAYASAVTAHVNLNDGAMTTGNAFNAETPAVASGKTLTNFHGLYVRGGTPSGTITNRYGIRIENLQGGTNKWGISQEGADDNNYFAGKVGIGTTNPICPVNIVSTTDPAIYATSTAAAYAVISGVNTGVTTARGVFGSGLSDGVYGQTTAGNGIKGEATTGYGGYFTSTSGYGIYSSSAGGSGVGVYGTGTVKGIEGVGAGTTGTGVYGYSQRGYSVYGSSDSDGKGGVFFSESGTALYSATTSGIGAALMGKVGIGVTDPTAYMDVNSDIIRVRTSKTPTSKTAAGNAGDICWDANYIYICYETNKWKRVAITDSGW